MQQNISERILFWDAKKKRPCFGRLNLCKGKTMGEATILPPVHKLVGTNCSIPGKVTRMLVLFPSFYSVWNILYSKNLSFEMIPHFEYLFYDYDAFDIKHQLKYINLISLTHHLTFVKRLEIMNWNESIKELYRIYHIKLKSMDIQRSQGDRRPQFSLNPRFVHIYIHIVCANLNLKGILHPSPVQLQFGFDFQYWKNWSS